MQIYFVDTVFAFIFSKFAVAGILSNYLIIKCLPIMTKHVPLFYLSEVFGYWRYSSLLYNLCSSGIGWQMAESPELFDTAFTLQERLDIPDGFVQREMVYISILLGTLVLCLFFSSCRGGWRNWGKGTGRGICNCWKAFLIIFPLRQKWRMWMMGCAILLE